MLFSFEKHTDLVEKVSWSENDNWIASASADASAIIWNPQNGEILNVLKEHTDDLLSIRISEIHHLASTTSFDKTCIIWDLNKGIPIYTFKDHSHYVNDSILTKDGKYVFTVSNDGRVIKYNLDQGNKEWEVQTEKDLNSIALINDEKNLIVAGDDCRLIFLDILSGEIVNSKIIHDAPIKTVYVSHDETLIATGGYDRKIKVFKYPSLDLIHDIGASNKWENSIAISPDNRLLISGSFRSTFFAFDLKEATEIATGAVDTKGINSIDSFEQFLAYGGDDSILKVLDLKSNKWLFHEKVHDSIIQGIKFSPNGKYIATTSYDETVAVTNFETLELEKVFVGHRGVVNTVAWNKTSNIIITGGYDGIARVWDLNTGNILKEIISDGSVIKSISWNHYHNLIAIAHNSRVVYLYDGIEFCLKGVFKGHQALINQLAWSSDGSRLVTVSRDKTIMIHHIDRMRSEVFVDHAHRKSIKSVSWSRSDKYIITGSYDTNVKIWDSQSGNLVKTIDTHTLGVAALVTTVDDQLVTGGWDNRLTITDITEDSSLIGNLKTNTMTTLD